MSASAKGLYQPLPQAPMDVKNDVEKGGCEGNDRQTDHAAGRLCRRRSQCQHGECHRQRRRRLFHFAAATLSLLVIVAFVMCSEWESVLFGVGSDDFEGSLWKRQNTGTGTGSHQGVFVKNKRERTIFFRSEKLLTDFSAVYLVVAIVGLFVCLVLAVMLSAWCCRGTKVVIIL